MMLLLMKNRIDLLSNAKQFVVVVEMRDRRRVDKVAAGSFLS